MYRYHFVSEMLNTFETFEVKEICARLNMIVRGRGGGGILFTVLMNVNGTSVLIHFNFETLSRFTSNSECMLN